MPIPPGRFSKDSLAEYAAYAPGGAPLFRTVGIDHILSTRDTQPTHSICCAGPAGFSLCSKVWEMKSPSPLRQPPRYGGKAGNRTRFLDVGAFQDMVLHPFVESLPGRTGPFIFEFQRSGLEPEPFLTRWTVSSLTSSPGMPTPWKSKSCRPGPCDTGHPAHSWRGAHLQPLDGHAAAPHAASPDGRTVHRPLARDASPDAAWSPPRLSGRTVRAVQPHRHRSTHMRRGRLADSCRGQAKVLPYVLVNNRSEGNARSPSRPLWRRWPESRLTHIAATPYA